MKFTSLTANNFLTLGRASIHLDGRGLNVIQGVNDADTSAHSNGAGKSSLVDALCWCLFGSTARGVKGDAVVNRTAKKDTEVFVKMVNGATEYIVVRYRKHKEFKNSLRLLSRTAGDEGMAPADLSKGTDADTQKEVERVLGCSQEVFLAAVYSGQEIMPDLPKMGDRDLKRLIEEAAGLQRIELAYEEARSRRLEVQGAMTANSTKVDSVKVRIARDESALLLKTDSANAWDAARADRVTNARATVIATTAQLTEAAAVLKTNKPAYDAHKAEVATIDASLGEHSAIEGAARAAETAATRADSGIDRAGLANARSVVATIVDQIANADVEMAKPCDECGKPHTADEKAEYIAHREKRLTDARANLALVEAKVRDQLAAAVTARNTATKARAKVPDVSATNARRAELVKQIDAFENEVKAARRLQQDVEAAKLALATRESEVNPFSDAVTTLKGQIAADAASLAALNEAQEGLRKRLEIADAVVKVFGPAGVRAQILDTVTPFLNDRTADYLSALSDGAITATWSTLTRAASGDLKEKFSIEVSSTTGGDSFLSLSGGEKRKVRLATALALQDLVASRATQPIDLWIGDEVDDALDPAGLERLMTILERKARERGTVLIISHNDLADWCDQITTVRKKDGYSTVEGSLSCV